MRGTLVLEDGTTFAGQLLSTDAAFGEVVFNTGMTGYQEILTDPSYCGQIIVLTYPMIGNYGISKHFMEARKSFAHGLVIDQLSGLASNYQSEMTLAQFLGEQHVPCLYDVDTRALTRHIRAAGTMKGCLVPIGTETQTIKNMLAQPLPKDVVYRVTTPHAYTLPSAKENTRHVVVMDFGVKRNILRSLQDFGFRLTVVPAATRADAVLALNPDGVFLSNGPGDPQDVPDIIREVKSLIGKKPIFGICLGHQLVALALGARTYKLKFGHRGSNQPVKDLQRDQVRISSQNHGYAVDEDSLKDLPLEITHRSVNDDTIEGLRHTSLPIFTVQYHPEASPGPWDNRYLFQEFWDMLGRGN